MAAADYPAAAACFRRAMEAGDGGAAYNLANMTSVGRGVLRSKKATLQCMRTAAELGVGEAGARPQPPHSSSVNGSAQPEEILSHH